MPAGLLQFDAFGMVRIDRSQITTSITAVTQDGKYINRMITEDCPIIHEIEQGKSASFLFGAAIEKGRKSRLAIRPLAEPNDCDGIENKPQVVQAIERALDFVRARNK